jgi:GDPmannose 4,6-dehydratase
MHLSSGILFNHESPRRGETFVTRKITKAAARIKLGVQDKLSLGNLDAKRDWGYAGDYVEAMWLMLQNKKPDDYVISTGETHTVREFLETVFDYAGLHIDKHVEIDPRLFRPHEVPVLLGDNSKAKSVLGWEPKIKFKQLAEMMYKEDYEYIKRFGEKEELR